MEGRDGAEEIARGAGQQRRPLRDIQDAGAVRRDSWVQRMSTKMKVRDGAVCSPYVFGALAKDRFV